MVFDIFRQTNFIDILIVILLFRICYIAAKQGLSVEIFKLCGIIFATYLSCHFYTSLSDIIQRSLPTKRMPLEFADFIVFITLALIGYLAFVLIRSIFYRFLKLEAVPEINKFGGLILGVIRAYFFIGLLIFTLGISSVNYISGSVKHSYLGSRVFLVAPNTYRWLWDNIFSKFSAKEDFNSTINEVIDRFNNK
ncbi:MAG: CvpA family protein [Candidatus Omnitrophica bacterium]|jgi:uncharacterized membrane protein required for colicin V production|nr:CvpA family protein [Candidatus Omnitrophota bacterium]MDD5661106.1 CvpA family protein [Candidatus Omnitrophota bacterium]